MKPALPLPDTSQARRSALVGGLVPSPRRALSLHADRDADLAQTVDVPASTKPSTAGTQPDASIQPRRVSGRPVKVQIVEDLPRVQQLLRQLVEQPGRFEVTGIDDTEQEAFQRSQAQPPDALVVDLNLRQGSGLGLIHAVRKLYGASPVGPLVIVVTNHTMPVLEAACLKAGADHFLDKSRELPRLSALLNQAFP
jgi:CheY-like chemotaxis protein